MATASLDGGVVAFLDRDPRPTFVVELCISEGRTICKVVHFNPALYSDATLLQDVQAIPNLSRDESLWKWLVGTVPGSPKRKRSRDEAGDSFAWRDALWTKTPLSHQLFVVGANEFSPSLEPSRKKRLSQVKDELPLRYDTPTAERQGGNRASILAPAEIEFGPMLPDFSSESQLFLDVIQDVDWGSNPLGPMDSWAMRLRLAFNQVITDSRAIAIYWGPEYIALYNEAFSKFCGPHHPTLLGQTVCDTWPHLKDQLDQIRGSAKYLKLEDESRFFVDKPDGAPEEIYVKWSLSPIIENRQCLGIYHSLVESTSARLWERRMKFLVDLGETLIAARDVKSYWARTLEELEHWSPSHDVPLAFMYSITSDDEEDLPASKYDSSGICHLEGSLGVPDDHPIAPSTLVLRDTDDGLASIFRDALESSTPLLLQVKNGSLPEKLLDGLEWRGFGDPCQAAIVCPIRPTKDEAVMGLLFLGLNPRRPYDNDYKQFVSLLNQKLTSSLASTLLFEQEARRGRTAAQRAADDRETLQKKLEYQTEQANQSIQTFRAVSGFIPVGMSFGDGQGNVTFANGAWHRITGYPKGPIAPGALLQCVLDEDVANISRAYEELKAVDLVTFEFRVRLREGETKSDVSPVRLLGDANEVVGRHVLASAKAERDPDGTVVRILTCLTDVTIQKHTAEVAVRRAQEAENLKRLAEFATVGMYDVSLDGRLLSANNLFWEFTGLPKVDLTTTHVEPWQACVVEEDLPRLWQKLDKLKRKGKPQTAEIRLKTMFKEEDASGLSISAPRWVLATFMPVKSSEGTIRSFTGCLSDVSLQKRQLDQEKLRKEEAIESKRQQENFIDMTSHEMRNPLSAMLHCTDAIIASLSRIQAMHDTAVTLMQANGMTNGSSSRDSPEPDEETRLLQASIESAETIVECAHHQRRIVDDILTMSKLDSKLLAVTPCTVNPILIAKEAFKMFEIEARRVDIALTWDVDKSYYDLGHNFLDLDPSRVKQVLINLLTNALKFTKSGTTRNVAISMKGSRVPPGKDMTAVEFIPRFCDPANEYEQPALKDRENPVYLLFEVRDTGQGLTEKEVGNLFNKFVQASAKTHVKYGGSGLGLFISRRLTELQNGAIGVSSQAGLGSTFAFYIEAYIPSEPALREAEAVETAAQLMADAGTGDAVGRGGTVSLNGSMTARELRAIDSGVHLDGILVVEDNIINQKVARQGLTDGGYAVDVANHGVEARNKLRRAMKALSQTSAPGSPTRSPGPRPIPINLVLMDMEMPVEDGLTCTRKIRKQEQEGEVFCASGGSIPIIAVTANARPEQIAEAKAAGCDDVMVKPYHILDLIQKMQTVVGTKRLMDGASSA